jgi:hypothetical protein
MDILGLWAERAVHMALADEGNSACSAAREERRLGGQSHSPAIPAWADDSRPLGSGARGLADRAPGSTMGGGVAVSARAVDYAF